MSRIIKISDSNHKALKLLATVNEQEMREIANNILEPELRERLRIRGMQYPLNEKSTSPGK